MLGETIGIEMELTEKESALGDFNVDILATEQDTGRRIIIENQLEDTNHDHLGKLITYASGKDAAVVIWIVRRARDEHRQAIPAAKTTLRHPQNDSLAQLVEHNTFNVGVVGSSPTRITKGSSPKHGGDSFFCAYTYLLLNDLHFVTICLRMF